MLDGKRLRTIMLLVGGPRSTEIQLNLGSFATFDYCLKNFLFCTFLDQIYFSPQTPGFHS